ncbi:bestrophin family protein [Mucilaginibacter terrae]|uniref:Membrane protein n=1 Tax=Mucilaginibacter terrae TaxID=1955052 RepID=A0ABU3GRZ9_9SPHI|nr:bestrophin family ion channel [Mucilaginibacter terrae]MDT3401737.1 putative membrane protein [Mucilaginibacter terrae]
MITYNPKDWFTFLFRFHKSDTLLKLFPLMLGVGIYSALVTWLLLDYIHLPDSSVIHKTSVVHSTLGFVLSLLLAFRINSAYDRWWEGRKLWGALVNNSRNLAIKVRHLGNAADVQFFNQHISLYAETLKDHLRDQQNKNALKAGFNPDKHLPNQVASAMIARGYKLNDGSINTEQLMSINAELMSFTDICGACERIKNTPIPYNYGVFIKKFIFFFIMSLPLTWAFELHYYIIPIIAFVLYVLASIELIAEEIEDPFGFDENDLPLEKIALNIKKHVGEILE